MSPPIEDQGYRQVYGINTEQIAEVTGTDLAQDYVQLAEGQAGEINAIPVPMLDRGSHLSYAFQWIAFGIMAPLDGPRIRNKKERCQRIAERALSTLDGILKTL